MVSVPKLAFSSDIDEFWYNVSQQDELPLAGEIELTINLQKIASAFQSLSQQVNETSAVGHLANLLKENPQLFSDLRQFLGVSDKRCYLELSYIASRIPHPTDKSSLCGCMPWTLSRHPMKFFLTLLAGKKGKLVQERAAEMLAKYLLQQGLWEAAKGFAKANDELLQIIYTRLIVPKEYQQKAAKRRGHGCEAAIAKVLEECGASLVPHDRASNPMGANDPHLDLDSMEEANREAGRTHAFDLLIKSNGRVRVALQSLIHTSDPGQYGVDKSNETVQIHRSFVDWNNKNPQVPVELWGLVDGVGFSENKTDTINKLISNFDYFVQLKTLYKAPLRLHELGELNLRGITFASVYDQQDIEVLSEKYVPSTMQVISESEAKDAGWRPVAAGLATIYV